MAVEESETELEIVDPFIGVSRETTGTVVSCAVLININAPNSGKVVEAEAEPSRGGSGAAGQGHKAAKRHSYSLPRYGDHSRPGEALRRGRGRAPACCGIGSRSARRPLPVGARLSGHGEPRGIPEGVRQSSRTAREGR